MRVPVALAIALLAAGLTGCVAYRPKVLSPQALENSFRTRALSDPGLGDFLRQNGVPAAGWPPDEIDVRTFALVGYYFSPDLALARAKLIASEAGVRVAGLRPNPSLSVEAGYNRNPESHVLYSILPSFTIETAGEAGLANSSGAAASRSVARGIYRDRMERAQPSPHCPLQLPALGSPTEAVGGRSGRSIRDRRYL